MAESAEGQNFSNRPAPPKRYEGPCVRGPLAGLTYGSDHAQRVEWRSESYPGTYHWMPQLGRWRWSKAKNTHTGGANE